MTAARERVLGAVRRSLRRAGPLPESVRAGLDRRLAAPIPNLKPALSEDPVSLFVREANAVHTRTSMVPTVAGVSEVVVRHIEDNGLDDAIVVAPELEGVQWSNRLAVERRAARGSDQLSVTGAFAGIAETGSVMLLSGPESPTTLNFLPEDHIVVLRESRIVPHPEDAWALLREERSSMPRTVNLICGPSKTGDVELVILEGAHGPRRFHVVVVQE
ncbi:MAG: LUD domain-containing protein [Thiotrichales bacterium]|nr:LUD domain-containing protein [Thiotrichales bacterium]